MLPNLLRFIAAGSVSLERRSFPHGLEGKSFYYLYPSIISIMPIQMLIIEIIRSLFSFCISVIATKIINKPLPLNEFKKLKYVLIYKLILFLGAI